MDFKRKLPLWIMLGVLVWGSLLAAGAYFNFRYDSRHVYRNPLRPLVVLGCITGFLAFWGLLLARRARKLDSQRDPRDPS